MTKIQTAVLLGAAAVAMTAPTAVAGASVSAGTPGTSQCTGQTSAYLAQASKAQYAAPGRGNLAKNQQMSVKETQALIEAYCAGA